VTTEAVALLKMTTSRVISQIEPARLLSAIGRRLSEGVSTVSKKNPGYYTPLPGRDPERIHRALETINGGCGATIEEIAKETGVPLAKVKKEMRWGKKGNAGFMVMEQFEEGGKILYRHTDRYEPIRAE
jgi:hypothetical protein